MNFSVANETTTQSVGREPRNASYRSLVLVQKEAARQFTELTRINNKVDALG